MNFVLKFGECMRILSMLSDPEGIHQYFLDKHIKEVFSVWADKSIATALDYGCGNMPYAEVIRRVAQQSVAIDIGQNALADIILEPDSPLPFESGMVDMVTSFQVLEHVKYFERYLSEVARVCRQGGLFVISVPSVWPFHPHPTDFRRWMFPGIESDLASAGFRIQKSLLILNPISSSIQFFLSVCRYMLWNQGKVKRAFVVLLACLLNPAILISERLFKSTYKLGAGNFLIVAIKDCL